MKTNNFNILTVLSLSTILLIYSCSSGGNRDIAPESFNVNNVLGDWFFSPNCDEYVFGTDTIYLSDQLPDTISVNSDSDSTLFIDAGANNLVANVDSNGFFIIDNQSFMAYLDLGFISDTFPISLNGTGSFSSNYEGSMDLSFSEPSLGAQIDCQIELRKIE